MKNKSRGPDEATGFAVASATELAQRHTRIPDERAGSDRYG